MGRRKREHREAVIAGREKPFREGSISKKAIEQLSQEERLRGLGLFSVRAKIKRFK